MGGGSRPDDKVARLANSPDNLRLSCSDSRLSPFPSSRTRLQHRVVAIVSGALSQCLRVVACSWRDGTIACELCAKERRVRAQWQLQDGTLATVWTDVVCGNSKTCRFWNRLGGGGSKRWTGWIHCGIQPTEEGKCGEPWGGGA